MIYSRRVIEGKQNLGASNNIKSKARELRKNQTSPEKILWSRIKKKQLSELHFRRQHPYNIYILDFYCFEANLAIEIDGKIHLNKRAYDKERTRFLESSGLTVLRFKNEDVETRIEWVLERISEAILKNSTHSDIHKLKGADG